MIKVSNRDLRTMQGWDRDDITMEKIGSVDNRSEESSPDSNHETDMGEQKWWHKIVPGFDDVISIVGITPAFLNAIGLVSGDRQAMVVCAQLATISKVFSNYSSTRQEISNSSQGWNLAANLTYLLIPKLCYGYICYYAIKCTVDIYKNR